ncbi:pirin family protein [Pseudobacteriovorax antillogorgiicola]|uniref:Pirin N-terminal domain-containing protein n=1 Tax=Pseudobacteriovorax antillogorgiicola TaxID=1513793 RepID=A0A1Y6CRY4_9BACT|nr:pirin family protein [Pseudobacteriovorax antillogorgiicola]TCS40922.1 hypothetical protein EDD56_1518 [Pseudobacteriovorax antillogorgiicola]SMF83990.1 hypothetical protein SAMN06296036_1518 [Pseudobacteriovorax antillogorgiicola]
MSQVIHRADSRGHADHGWLNSHHTFSFASYFDPKRMGFGALRVINDDVVAPSRGFGTHPHANMEIISVPLEGSLAHKDTMGHDFVISKGEVQAMTAGTGVAHSEFNHSDRESVNFLQIWVLPRLMGVKPAYSQKTFEPNERVNRWQLVVSPDGRQGSVTINQDAHFSMAKIDVGRSLDYELQGDDHGAYIFVISGNVKVDGETLGPRDGLGLTDPKLLTIAAESDAEILLMDVPMTVI